jgi:predicted DsbA family dithiol-disulfide isomerase
VYRAYFIEEQDIGDISVLASLAERVGLDKAAFIDALAQGVYTQREKEAVAYAKTVLQPKGVPAIYINGEKVNLPGYTKDDLIRVLEDEAAKYEDDFGFGCGEDGCG